MVFYKEALGDTRSERLYCSSAEQAVVTSHRRVFNRVRRRIRRGRLLRLRISMGVWTSRSSRSTTLLQEGRNVGARSSQKAPSVSTWPAIQDRGLGVGDIVDSGWGLQPKREQGPLWTLMGLQQHATAIGGKQEQPRDGVVTPASRRARGLPPSPSLRISVESCIRSRI